MNGTLQNLTEKIKTFWSDRSKKQKGIFIGSVFVFIILIITLSIFFSSPKMVPLYSDLTPTETGSIKESLDSRGIKSEITNGGTTIKVPESEVETLLVELAAEGLPQSGNIDYSFFAQNSGIGMTDNEFNVMKIDAMQTEIANLIKGIDGIKDAKVMISIPEQGIFVSDQKQEASASIVLNTKPGYHFEEKQIKALYHLVSKSVPNLPTDNIVIMNQNFEYFDLENTDNYSSGNQLATQLAFKKEIEKDLQRQVQNMLGMLMGHDKVVVSVTADLDFTQERRDENIVLPVDEENMEGIAISAQRITETYTGSGATVGGVPQSEDPADSLGTSYLEGTNGDGEYERIEETINNEVSRVQKEIIESPYKIRDLGIQVMVEPPNAKDPNSLSAQTVEDITKILSTIVRTTIDKSYTDPLTDEDIKDKIAVSVHQLNGKSLFDQANSKNTSIPWWVYIVGAALILAIILLLVLFLRSRKTKEEEMMEEVIESEEVFDIPDVNEEKETEDKVRRRQLEKMAKEKPEEFAKLIRTWLAQD